MHVFCFLCFFARQQPPAFGPASPPSRFFLSFFLGGGGCRLPTRANHTKERAAGSKKVRVGEGTSSLLLRRQRAPNKILSGGRKKRTVLAAARMCEAARCFFCFLSGPRSAQCCGACWLATFFFLLCSWVPKEKSHWATPAGRAHADSERPPRRGKTGAQTKRGHTHARANTRGKERDKDDDHRDAL